jgi:hypothetical protein
VIKSGKPRFYGQKKLIS